MSKAVNPGGGALPGAFPVPAEIGHQRCAQDQARRVPLSMPEDGGFTRVVKSGDGNLPLLPRGPAGPARRGPALMGVLTLYAGGWGVGLLNAGVLLLDPSQPGTETALSGVFSVVRQLTGAALLVWAAIMFAGRYGLTPARLGLERPRTRWDWEREAGMFATAVFLPMVASGIGNLFSQQVGLPTPGYPRADPAVAGPWDTVTDLLSSALAGPSEEIVLLAVTVSVLRRARFTWPGVFAAAVLMRVAFHIYYGAPSLFLAIWALGMVLMYARTGRAWGAIIAHSLWDVTASLRAITGAWVPIVLLLVAAIAALGVALTAGVFNRQASPPPSLRRWWRVWWPPRVRLLLLTFTVFSLALVLTSAAVTRAADVGWPDALGVASVIGLAIAMLTTLLAAVLPVITPKGLRVDETRPGLACVSAVAVMLAGVAVALVAELEP